MRQMTADAWADYADVSASLNGNQLAGEPERYVNEALQLDPRHPKALWLQGSVEHETRRYAQAMATWQRLLAVMEPGSSDAKLISGNLEEDRRLAAGADNKPAAAGAVTVRGEVTLGEKLRAQVRPGMTLYILAKSVDSPGAPVAVIRSTTNTWPVSFELNDSQAMLPGRNLSSAGKVIVEARISISGQAASQPGDLLGSTAPLQPAGSKPLHIVIDKVAG
jgi:cytochrome c-type biogenesis protein CcmH